MSKSETEQCVGGDIDMVVVIGRRVSPDPSFDTERASVTAVTGVSRDFDKSKQHTS